ncbi:MAG: DUF5693 family protein [bacterium]
MNDKRVILLVTFALIVSIAVSASILYKRINAEKANNVVELAADFSDIKRLSMVQNAPIDLILAKLRIAGVSAVALTEDMASSADINLLSGVDPKKVNLYIPSKGMSSKKIKLVQNARLRVIPRIRNAFNLSGEIINSKIKAISAFDSVIFAEQEVLGHPNYLKETARALKAGKLRYGYVEFGKQTGASALASYMEGNLIKVHSIPPEELEDMPQEQAVGRFVRAARERGARILYVHLFQYPENGKDLISTNLSFVKTLKDELLSCGFVIGQASMPEKISVSNLEKSLIGLGVAGGAVLLLHYFLPVNLYISLAFFVLFALLTSKILALLSAVIFPAYAVISMFPAKRDPIKAGVIFSAISIVMCIAAIAAVGAVFIAALLSDKVHMIGVDAFTGVKIALILPLLIVASYFLFRRENEEKLDIKASMSRAKELLDINIKISHVVLFLLAAACGALFILRSGNFGFPVSMPEKYVRGLLENIMVIRPRTKEFLIGYPALILAAIYYMKGGNKWLWALLVAGVLAPVSMTNSFCHIHTPVLITLVRSCVGLVLGVALGLLAYFAWLYCNLPRLKSGRFQ